MTSALGAALATDDGDGGDPDATALGDAIDPRAASDEGDAGASDSSGGSCSGSAEYAAEPTSDASTPPGLPEPQRPEPPTKARGSPPALPSEPMSRLSPRKSKARIGGGAVYGGGRRCDTGPGGY